MAEITPLIRTKAELMVDAVSSCIKADNYSETTVELLQYRIDRLNEALQNNYTNHEVVQGIIKLENRSGISITFDPKRFDGCPPSAT